MQSIIDRYRDKQTYSGHDLRVDDLPQYLVIWYLYWGEYEGVDGHHHMGIAKIKTVGDKLAIGWLQGVDKQPYHTEYVDTVEKLFERLDAEIAQR